MRNLACAFLLVAGCGDNPMTMPQPPPAPLTVCSPLIPAPGVAVPTDQALASSMDTRAICSEASINAVIDKAPADIVPDGYLALGDPVTFSSGGGAALPALPHGIDFVIGADLGKGPTGAPSSRIVVVEKRGAAPAVVTLVTDVVYEAYYHRLHFHGDALATYQAAIPKDAGASKSRHYTFRAIGGVSMGGIGSSINFWRHPERYDAIAVMGADPGPDLTYILGVTQDWFFGGFCTAADEKAGTGKIGQLCPSPRKPMLDQMEEAFDFEHFNYQAGEGVGLTLRRPLYVRAFRDLSRAYGNAAYATAMGDSTYLPPGVPPSTLMLDNATACDPKNAIRLKGFYDWRYNPDGAFDVITFCDGGDSEAKGLGVYDDSLPQLDPTQIMLAVDVNGNGKRDSGEPVVLQGAEPYRDVGTDGLADKDEPGYDPVKNPDPNHDDFHWRHNPAGTEGNWRYDKGEPFDDFGIDGVQGKGCPVGSAPGCFDLGEGDGAFTYNPNVQNWLAHDPHSLADTIPDDQLARVDVYYDAGIRDFFNAHVSTNTLAAVLQRRGAHVRVWDGFPLLTNHAPSDEMKFDINAVDFAPLGRHVYVRYGDPDASQAAVEQTGDGRHVGTVLQATHRAQMLFYFLDSVWPDGDRDLDVGGAPDAIDDMFTAKNGRVTPYVVALPPGYADAKNATRTYPVVYFMHGYGMQPMDLGVITVLGSSAMVSPKKPMQKFIIVVVDGACRPGGDINGGPLPPDGDLCEEGTFYGDHPDGTAKAEQQLLELQTIIEAKYRTRAAADVTVTQ